MTNTRLRKTLAPETSLGLQVHREHPRGETNTFHLGMRCPEDLQAPVSEWGASNQTRGAVRMMEFANDIKNALGEDWLELVVATAREQQKARKEVYLGQVAGRLLKELLAAEKKRR